MKKHKVLSEILKDKIMAVIRTDSHEKAINIADACIEGGIKILEVTFTSSGAHDIIKELVHKYKDADVIIGAGTVLDSETARVAILNGAEFIVSPSLNLDVIKLCNRYNKLTIPGVMTVTEIVKALESGVELVKVFPASTLGMGYIRAVKAPIPQVMIMPTGGISLDNAQDWLKAGSSALGIGGTLTNAGKDGNYAKVTEVAKEFRNIVNRFNEEE